jgi:hypothetical protein
VVVEVLVDELVVVLVELLLVVVVELELLLVVVVVGVNVVVLVVVDVEVLVELELVVVLVDGGIVVLVVVVLLVELLLVVVVVDGGIVVVLVVVLLVELVLVVVVVHSSVSITTIFADTLRATDVFIQVLHSPCKTIVSGCPVSQLPIKNDSAEVAVLYSIYDLQPVNVVVLVVVGLATTSISQGSSKQRSGSLHLLTQPTVMRITLLAIIATEYSCT